jgi:choline dehydrogenase
MLNYAARKSGPLVSNLIEAGAYSKSHPDLPACDLEISFLPLGSLERGLVPPAEHGFCLFASLLTPRSRGRVSLASADPLAPPRIDPCYASAPEDREALQAAAKLARSIAMSDSFRPYRGPAAAGDWQETARSLFHPGGSCKMGQDPSSVVNSALQVQGVAGLRVADASIMPVIPRAHPNATVMMIGEKAAKLILGG